MRAGTVAVLLLANRLTLAREDTAKTALGDVVVGIAAHLSLATRIIRVSMASATTLGLQPRNSVCCCSSCGFEDAIIYM